MHFSAPIDAGSGIWEDTKDLPQNPATLLDLMSVDVANLLATARASPSLVIDITAYDAGAGDILSESPNLLMRAKILDSKLAMWHNMVPSTWVPCHISAHQLPQNVVYAGIYSDGCDVFPDIMVCSTWNDWRVARLKVLSLIAHLGPNDTRAQALVAIQQLVDGICASIPFSLGSRTEPGLLYEMKATYPTFNGQPMSKEHQKTSYAYGGWYLFAPLKETMNVGMHLREGQLGWLRGQLIRLAKIYDVVPVGGWDG